MFMVRKNVAFCRNFGRRHEIKQVKNGNISKSSAI